MADRLKQLTAEIVSSYVEANKIAPADLAALIESTLAALDEAGQPSIKEPEAAAKPTASQIRRSITPDALISFVDGRPYRMLKRHLTAAGLTPADYRAKFGLPKDYPLTAPSYSAQRTALALSLGLGRRPMPEPVTPASAPKATTVVRAPSRKTPKGEKAGPGARVPKAVRSPQRTKLADEESN